MTWKTEIIGKLIDKMPNWTVPILALIGLIGYFWLQAYKVDAEVYVKTIRMTGENVSQPDRTKDKATFGGYGKRANNSGNIKTASSTY